MAAVLACGPGAVLSHRSRGRPPRAPSHRSGQDRRHGPDGRSPRKHAGHRHPPLDDAHRRRTSQPSTASRAPPSPARCSTSPRSSTAARSSGRSTRPRSSSVFDLARSRTSSLATRPAPRAKRLRAVLDRALHRHDPDRSELEERFLALCPRRRPARCPRSTLGRPPRRRPAGDPRRLRLARERVIVETDGHKTHGTRQAFEQRPPARPARWRRRLDGRSARPGAS